MPAGRRAMGSGPSTSPAVGVEPSGARGKARALGSATGQERRSVPTPHCGQHPAPHQPLLKRVVHSSIAGPRYQCFVQSIREPLEVHDDLAASRIDLDSGHELSHQLPTLLDPVTCRCQQRAAPVGVHIGRVNGRQRPVTRRPVQPLGPLLPLGLSLGQPLVGQIGRYKALLDGIHRCWPSDGPHRSTRALRPSGHRRRPGNPPDAARARSSVRHSMSRCTPDPPAHGPSHHHLV